METTPRFRDKVKDTFKDREIKKTVVTHWQNNKDRYITGALCIVGTALLMNSGPEFHHGNKAINVFSRNQQTNIVIKKPGNSGDILMDASNGKLYYSRNQAAHELGKTRQAVQKDISNGHLTKIQPGNISTLGIS